MEILRKALGDRPLLPAPRPPLQAPECTTLGCAHPRISALERGDQIFLKKCQLPKGPSEELRFYFFPEESVLPSFTSRQCSLASHETKIVMK